MAGGTDTVAAQGAGRSAGRPACSPPSGALHSALSARPHGGCRFSAPSQLASLPLRTPVPSWSRCWPWLDQPAWGPTSVWGPVRSAVSPGRAARGAAPRGAERGRPRGAPGKPRAVGWSRLPFWGGSQVVRGGPSAQSTPDGPRGHVQTLGSGGPDSGPVRRPHSASPVGRRVFEGALPPSAPSPAPCGSRLRLREAPGVSA